MLPERPEKEHKKLSATERAAAAAGRGQSQELSRRWCGCLPLGRNVKAAPEPAEPKAGHDSERPSNDSGAPLVLEGKTLNGAANGHHA